MALTFIERLTRRPATPSVVNDEFLVRSASLDDLHHEIEQAIAVGDADFAVRLGRFVADAFPTDHWTRRLLGRAYLENGDWERASSELDLALSLDPEDAAGSTMLGVAHCSAGRTREAIRAFERAVALDSGESAARASLAELVTAENLKTDSSAPPLARYRQVVDSSTEDVATAEIDSGLKLYPRDLNVLLLRVELLWKYGRLGQAEKLCRQILTRHPRALVPRYILGHILLTDSAREGAGADLIRSTLPDDATGIVARRIYDGTGFDPTTPARQQRVDLPAEFATPRAVAGAIDLIAYAAAGGTVHDEPTYGADLFLDAVGSEGTISEPDDLADLDEPAASPVEQAGSNSVQASSRPWLLGISVRQSVIRRYGLDGYERLERRLNAVGRELNLLGVTFSAVFVDDAASMASFQCAAATNLEAPSIRNAIHDLWRHSRDVADDSTVARDRAIVLIGGDDIIPFFRVPNPADDDDGDVLSDGPYGALDATSQLLPDLAVGRLLDGYSGNLSQLLRQLDNLVEARREPLIQGYPRGILGAGRLALNAIGFRRSRTSALACVAADRTAIAGLVVSALTPSGSVQTCPPADSAAFDLRWFGDHRCLFFDVSGTPDGESWFGQAVENVKSGLWESPAAFGADNLAETHLRSPVVFTTAGYATHFAAEKPSGSLALRFLNEGAAAFVGSSASTYGGSLTPLSGADLLANLFWRHLYEGHPVGKALTLARTTFASIELDRQGILDGDDQKTLLEFGVYGDPLFRVFEKRGEDEVGPDPLVVGWDDFLCRLDPASADSPTLDRRLICEVAEFITAQHPELASASIRVQRRHVCDGSCNSDIHRGVVDDRPGDSHGVTFVSARTEVGIANVPGATLARLARASLDDEGQIVKLVISR